MGGRWDRLKTKYASFFKLYCQNKFLPALKLQSPKPIRPHEKTTSYISTEKKKEEELRTVDHLVQTDILICSSSSSGGWRR